MFHGGTNFGFTAGANHDDTNGYMATVTSYDYDCPLSEAGDMTEKYYLVKECLEKRYGKAEDIKVENSVKKAYGRVDLTKKGGLFYNLKNLCEPVDNINTLTMEALKLPSGFVMYSTTLRGATGQEMKLSIDGMRDRALIYINGELKGVKDYSGKGYEDEIMLQFGLDDDIKLDILVENMARTNFGHNIAEKKGIADGIRVGNVHHTGFTMHPMELTDISNIEYTAAVEGQPMFYTGELEVDEAADTFIYTDGFTKGVVFVNGYNIGRYWNTAGPQKSLYIPAPLLKKGTNSITVFELERSTAQFVTLLDKHDIG